MYSSIFFIDVRTAKLIQIYPNFDVIPNNNKKKNGGSSGLPIRLGVGEGGHGSFVGFVFGEVGFFQSDLDSITLRFYR
jgi:hypothetical protein